MKISDLGVLMRGMAPVIKEYVADAVTSKLASLDDHIADVVLRYGERLEALEHRAQEKGERQLTIDDVRAEVKGAIQFAHGDLSKFVVQEVELKMAEIPRPKDGERGERGEPGERGEKGETGLAGRDGLNGQPGRDGERGEKGMDGKDGINGKDGADGIGFDDMDVTHDGERQFTISCAKGDWKKEWTFTVPVMIQRGLYQHDKKYVYQDVATSNGCQWVCMQPEAKGRPGDPNSGWLLVVKHGRDAKDRT